MVRSRASHTCWPLCGVMLFALVGCAVPEVAISASFRRVTLVPGGHSTITLMTQVFACAPDRDCLDLSGLVFDYVLNDLPQGVTYTVDRSLQTVYTPGVVRITFEAIATAPPGYSAALVEATAAG